MTNPVDLAGAGEQDVASYARGVAVLLGSDQVDGVLLTGYFGGYSTEESNLTEPELAAAHQMAGGGRRAGQAARRADDLPRQPGRAGAARRGHPGAPRRRPRVHACWPASSRSGPSGLGTARCRDPAPPVTDTSYDAARALFAEAGVALPGRGVGDRRSPGSRPRVDAVGLPVVLKATGRLHKSEGGGVVVGLADRESARAAYADLVDAPRTAGRVGRGDGRPRPTGSS